MPDADKTRIVVIDDDDSISDAIQLLVEMHGWEARTYRSCEAFIDGVDGNDPPDCLVLDLHFKGMSGVELQQCLAREGMTIPTVVLTAWPDSELSSMAAKAGAIEIMTKPASSEQLLEAIENAVSQAPKSSKAPVRPA